MAPRVTGDLPVEAFWLDDETIGRIGRQSAVAPAVIKSMREGWSPLIFRRRDNGNLTSLDFVVCYEAELLYVAQRFITTRQCGQ